MFIIGSTAVNLIKQFEQFKSKPYHGELDPAGLYTIGYGTIKYPSFYMNGAKVDINDPPISEEQASSFLLEEVKRKTAYIDPFLRDDLSENQFAALASFEYNLGEGALRHSSLLMKVNANKFDNSIRDAFRLWVKDFRGNIVPGLKRRRDIEADLYFTP